MVQPAGVGGHGNHHFGVQVNLVERKRHRPFLFSLSGSLSNLFGHLFLLSGGLRLLIRLLLLHGLLLILLLGLLLHGLLLHRLLLLLILLLRLSHGLLTVVIVVATADQRQTGRADPCPRRGSQERPPAQLSMFHPLPIVSVAHSNSFLHIPPRAIETAFEEVCLVGFAIATLVNGPRLAGLHFVEIPSSHTFALGRSRPAVRD